MDKKILDYIQDLSIKDKKTLSQKALKVCEEVGELAKAVLPYESAPATRHRFVDKHKILEEVSDTILTAISIAYDLGFSHSDIEEMLDSKSKKWQELQTGEEEANFPLPFEIHVTVSNKKESEKIDDEFIQHFMKACSEINVKPIVLNLENNDGTQIKDVMTSSKFYGDNRTVYEEVQRIENALMYRGFKVVRQKIESAPWHPGAPKNITDKVPDGCYFESHIAVEIDGSEEMKSKLISVAQIIGAHLSKNVFKKVSEGKYIIMLTIRDYTTYRKKFENRVQKAIEFLNSNGWTTPKKEVEFCIYDTKISHDYLWINEK